MYVPLTTPTSSTCCTKIKSSRTQSPLLDGFIECLEPHFPKGNPLISNLHVKLETFLWLFKLSTVPILPPSSPETSHPFCGPLSHTLLRNPNHVFFQGISAPFPVLPSSPTFIAKIPQVLYEPSVFFCKKPEETTVSKTALVPARLSQGVGGGWREEEDACSGAASFVLQQQVLQALSEEQLSPEHN